MEAKGKECCACWGESIGSEFQMRIEYGDPYGLFGRLLDILPGFKALLRGD